MTSHTLMITALSLPPVWSKMAEKVDASPEYIQKNIDRAVEAYRNKNYKQSLDFIVHVIRSDMNNPKLRYLAAHIHWKNQNYRSAEIHFNAFLNAQPNKLAGYIDLASMYHEKGSYEKSRELIRGKIEKLQSEGQEIPIKLFNILARSYLYEREISKIMEHSSAAKALFSSEKKYNVQHKLETLLIESRAYLLKTNFQKAEISALWASEIDKNNEYCLNLLGVVYLKWAENTTDKKKKAFLYKNAKESFEKAMYHIDDSMNLYKIIKKNLEKVIF